MSVLIGVHPGGKAKFAVCGLFWNGKLPATVFHSRSHSGVDDVLSDIVGMVGEWSSLDAIAIDAPLSWSGSPSGWRGCDLQVRRSLPAWLPKVWVRPPNTLPGAIAVQGPALTWALAREVKLGQIPEHTVVETNPRLSLAYAVSDLRHAVLGYRARGESEAAVAGHIADLTRRFVDTGVVRVETDPPRTPEELDALVCALVALAKHEPDSGLLIGEWMGGDIRPVGRRQVAILRALP